MIYNNHLSIKYGLEDNTDKLTEKLVLDMFSLISKDSKGDIIHEGASIISTIHIHHILCKISCLCNDYLI